MKSVQEAARAYGISEMSVYNRMHRLGFEHLKGRLISVKTRTELDRIKELEELVLRLKQGLADEVMYLKELGYDISMEGGYFLLDREFDDGELRMLIDSVLFSKQLTQKQAKSLIGKLQKQGNRYFSAKVAHIRNLPDLQHADNKHLMYALDAVNDAIADKKKISFIYNDYGTDFKLHPPCE